MRSAVTIREKDEDAMQERKCIVTGGVRDRAGLIRFVVSPDGVATPDIAGKLPGRGMWVTADRAIIDRAVAKNAFSKAAKTSVSASADLSDLIERQILQRMFGDLGLARRSGALVSGFDNVIRAMESRQPPALLVEALDGAEDGRRKILGAARAKGLDLPVLDALDSGELSVALGRENVIHAALNSGPLADRLQFEAARLSGFRAKKAEAGSRPARERFE